MGQFQKNRCGSTLSGSPEVNFPAVSCISLPWMILNAPFPVEAF
jgi:hypothetical protein